MITSGKQQSSVAEPPRHYTGHIYLLIFALVAAGIMIIGLFAYRNYALHYRTGFERQLSAIADLKVNELKQWRKERLGDGLIFFENSAFADLVRRSFAQPSDSVAQAEIMMWLDRVLACSQYERVFLLDAQGVERMAVPGHRDTAAINLTRDADTARRSGQMAFLDFNRDSPTAPIHLGVIVPILEGADTNHPLGVLVFYINPNTYLYPFIKTWPTPSQSAETLLVRREGNEVLFLNEIRFQTNTALNLRSPLTRTEMPAVRAALGHKGIMDGMDYRNVPVVAALRDIPDSPWALVARMDKAEIFAPVQERLWQTVFLVAILILGSGAGAGMIWRQQEARHYREQYEMAEASRNSELRYRRLFESAKDGILILDAESGMIVDVNPFLVKLLGFSNESFLGKKVWDLGFFKDIVANQDNFAELKEKEYLRYEDLPLETGDGRRIDVEFVSNVYMVNQQKVIQCSIRDITDRKLAERTIKKVASDLERSNKELEQFAYVASHDLQEPLRMVSSYTQLLADRYKDRLDQDAKDFIGYAVDGAVRMQRLITDLLTYSRVQTKGRIPDSIDSHSALGAALANLTAAIEESVAIITNDDLPTVKADYTQLVQVFQNLISNAIKFRGDTSPRVHVSATRTSQLRSGAPGGRDEKGQADLQPLASSFWTFSVRDNGIGIEPQYFERIFVIFQRLHSQTKYPGTGVGLALCKRIVERHGGTIWVESEIGKGTTFYFTLPA